MLDATLTLRHLKTALLLIPLAVAGCRSGAVRRLPDGFIVAVAHSSGGPAPYMSWLGIYPNGDAVYRGADNTLRRFHVDDAAFARIQLLLARPQLRVQLADLTARSRAYSDFEEVAILLGQDEYRFICREVPPHGGVLDLVRTLRALGEFRVGDRPFLGSACTAERPPHGEEE